MTQDQEAQERSLWRKRQIEDAQLEEQNQAQREYKPRTRWMLTCQQLGVCQFKRPRCHDCSGD